jgi:hypothetical protein
MRDAHIVLHGMKDMEELVAYVVYSEQLIISCTQCV